MELCLPHVLKDIDEYKFEIEHMAKNYDFEGYQFLIKKD